jgi:hypothetical protein
VGYVGVGWAVESRTKERLPQDVATAAWPLTSPRRAISFGVVSAACMVGTSLSGWGMPCAMNIDARGSQGTIPNPVK